MSNQMKSFIAFLSISLGLSGMVAPFCFTDVIKLVGTDGAAVMSGCIFILGFMACHLLLEDVEQDKKEQQENRFKGS